MLLWMEVNRSNFIQLYTCPDLELKRIIGKLLRVRRLNYRL